MTGTRPGARWTDDTGSLPMAMLVMVIGLMLSASLTPMVVTQIQSTGTEIERVHALHAAQSGLDTGLARIRAATDSTGAGDRRKLPCGTGAAPINGRVGAGGPASYQVTVDYLSVEPRGRQLDDAWVAANRIACSPGFGTAIVPAYALVRSAGTDTVNGAQRLLFATYTFTSSNANIPGGLIRVFKTATSTDLCMDAGSASPAAATQVLMQRCAPDSPQQKWAYHPDLTISLVSSRTESRPLGMCLDAGTSQVNGARLRVQPCVSSTTPPPHQQWSFNVNAEYEGTSNGSTLNGMCINVQTPNLIGSPLELGSRANDRCGVGSYNNIRTWAPEAEVGAGAAGMRGNTGQLVNFEQFGRCLDAPLGDPNQDYLIAWPCKQKPDPSQLDWNQIWTIQSNGRITATANKNQEEYPNGLYCLKSPRTTARGRYVDIVLCPAVIDDSLRWTVHRNTGTYATSYRIVDRSGLCLAPLVVDPADPLTYTGTGFKASKVSVATCSASELQKWNAPPSLQVSTGLKDVGER